MITFQNLINYFYSNQRVLILKKSIKLYENIFKDVVDNHAPLVTKFVNSLQRPPWMDAEYVAARKERRQLFKIWQKDKNVYNRTIFEESREAVVELSNEKRCNYYQNFINNSAVNSQLNLFKVCDTLLDTKQQSQLPYSEDFDALATDFNNFFISKIENIRKKLDVCEVAKPIRLLILL